MAMQDIAQDTAEVRGAGASINQESAIDRRSQSKLIFC